MATFEFTWGLFTGVFSIFVVIPGCLVYLHSQLPSQRLGPMFEILQEAEELLLSCTEEGLVYGLKAESFRSKLDQLRLRAEGARFQAHSARTYAEDVANLIKGLSRHIYEICSKVRDVRADISKNSLRERERQAALRGSVTTMTRNAPGDPVVAVDSESTASDSSPLAAFPDNSAVDVTVEREGAEQSLDHVNELRPAPSHLQLDQAAAPFDAPATPSPGQDRGFEEPSPSSAATPLTAVRNAGQSKHRRCSVFSVSSGTPSLQSMRRKKLRGIPLPRARTMARFVRQVRRTARAPPVFTIDLHRLASFEFAESDDDSDEWNDEEVVRIVA